MEGLISLLLIIALIGVVAWAITLLPMPQPFRTVIIVVAVIVALLYAMRHLGIAV